jgi:hypothetical protein
MTTYPQPTPFPPPFLSVLIGDGRKQPRDGDINQSRHLASGSGPSGRPGPDPLFVAVPSEGVPNPNIAAKEF